MKPINNIIEKVSEYYSGKINESGPVHRGVDWNSKESQCLRFEQLLKICDSSKVYSINDYGCGYGALIEYMRNLNFNFEYYGFDVSMEMISQAKRIYSNIDCCHFSDKNTLQNRDYCVASGVLNVKLGFNDAEWRKYIVDVLDDMNKLSDRGFSFNMLTSYSDDYLKRDNLYYGDPCFYFDLCKKRYSKNISVLHDYDLYEFTILVRK